MADLWKSQTAVPYRLRFAFCAGVLAGSARWHDQFGVDFRPCFCMTGTPRLQTQMGPHTGNARDFKSYDEVSTRLKDSCLFLFRICICIRTWTKMFAEYSPCLLQSAMMRGCIEKAADITRARRRISLFDVDVRLARMSEFSAQ